MLLAIGLISIQHNSETSYTGLLADRYDNEPVRDVRSSAVAVRD